jgi:hypothetical protein
LFYFILPYIEQDPLYKSVSGHSYTSTAVVQTYIAPLDPSLQPNLTCANSKGILAGQCSYEVNGYILMGDAGAICNFVGGCAPQNGDTAGPNYPSGGIPATYVYPYPSIPKSISDGTSNTIIVVERYSYNCLYNTGVYGNRTWGEDNGGPSQWAPVLIHAGLFDIAPVVGKQSCYQPQAYTSSGCQVAMVDGSVHNAATSLSATTWWRLLLPNDGQVLGPDWK